MKKEFSLELDGRLYRGWTGVRINRGVEQFAHSFSLEYTDKLDNVAPWKIAKGDGCVLKWGREKIITSYVSRASKNVSGGAYRVGADGRSVTADLVDCSAIHESGRWKNTTLETIVRDLCDPFGIAVIDKVHNIRKFKRFELDDGETAHTAIDRACQMRGCLPVTNARGSVELVRFDNISTLNEIDFSTIIDQGVTEDEQNQHSEYIFKGQTHADDENFNHNATTKKGLAADPSVSRYRPLIILAEDAGSKADLGERAIWERNTRAARAVRYTYTLKGFTDPNDNLWNPGDHIVLRDPVLEASGAFLITSVSSELTNRRKSTTLTLVDPKAYSVLE